MKIYLMLIFLIIILGLILENKNKKIYSVIIFVILTLIAGLRHYTIGNDTIAYVNTFNNITSSINNSNLEKGYLFLLYFLKNISKHYSILLFTVSLIINFSICKTVKKESKNMCVSYLIFIFSLLYFQEMNIMRQYLAMSIILLSLDMIKQKKIFQYIIMIIIASMFHTSAIIALPLYFIYNINFKKKHYIILMIISIICFVFLEQILTFITLKLNFYSTYVKTFSDNNKLASILGTLMFFVVFILIELMTKKEKDKYSPFDRFLYNILFITFLLSFMAIRVRILSRIIYYFKLFIILIIPNFSVYIPKAKNRLLYYIIMFMIFIGYFAVVLYYRPYWNYVYPYLFFWE